MREVTNPDVHTLIIESSSQVGKALAVDTPIPTPDGWKSMADLRVGDIVFDESGKNCYVTFITPIMQDRECFRLGFSDGSEIVADSQHRWMVHDGHERKCNYRILTTHEIFATRVLFKDKSCNRYAVPVAAALADLPRRDLPLHPYALGVWLGDGNSRSTQVTLHEKDLEIADYLRECGVRVVERRGSDKRNPSTCNLHLDPYSRVPFCIRNHDTRKLGLTKKGYCAECARQTSKFHQYGGKLDPVVNPVPSMARELAKLGLLSSSRNLYKKHIPLTYLRASYEQRLALLQGLMDTDGSIGHRGRCEFSTTISGIQDGFGELLSSLGIKYTIYKVSPRITYLGCSVDCAPAWRFSFLVYNEKPVFRLKRKLDLLPAREGRRTTETERRRIVAVEPCPSVPVRCIQVNSPSHLYLAGKTMIPTHNTELCLNVTGYYVHQDPSPILVIEPTLDIAEAYSKDRLAPMVRDTPVLSQLIQEARSRDTGNTILHKRFPGGHVTLAGSNSPSGLASRPIRILICDEIDRYAPSAGAEGNPISLASKRTTTFWNRKKLFVSSPTIKGISAIEASFLASDRRYFHVPCWACKQKQKLEWAQVKFENRDPKTALYACSHCGAGWNDAERAESVMEGEWIAEAEFNGTAGFHLWEAYNPWVRLSEIVESFLAAHLKQEQGDNEPMKAFVNTTLGQTWEEKAETVSADPLLSRREQYAADCLPYRILYLTAGVDVQDDRLETEIIGWRAEKRNQPEESWGVEVIILHGDPAKPDIWEQLDEVLRRDWTTEDGRRLRLQAVAIDTGGHHADEVYKFCTPRRGRQIYAIKGMAGSRPMWPPKSGGSKKYKGHKVWILGVDTAKDAIYSRLRIADEGPGYCHFPLSYDHEFFKQLTSEKVQARFVKGHPIREWHKPPGVRNEALDRRAYALSVLYARSIPWEILVRSAPTEPTPPKEPPGGDKPPTGGAPPASGGPPKRTPTIGIRPVRIRIR
jgi:phage terminase large subunit GpA-like protein